MAMSLFGPPNVNKLRSKRNLSGLIKALAWQPQEDIRAAAARALGDIGDARAVMPLTVTLRDPEWSVRHASAEALTNIPDARAIPHLLAAISDDSVFVRHAAGTALVKIGEPAVMPLITALKDSVPYKRETAAWALGRLHDDRAVKPLNTVLLKDNDSDARLFAAESLGLLAEHGAVHTLVVAMSDRDSGVSHPEP
jgi:HEAT repeat protein